MLIDHDHAWVLGLALILVGGLLAFGLPTFMEMFAGSNSIFMSNPKRRRIMGIILTGIGILLAALSALEHLLRGA